MAKFLKKVIIAVMLVGAVFLSFACGEDKPPEEDPGTAGVTLVMPDGAAVSGDYKLEYTVGEKVNAPSVSSGGKGELTLPAGTEFVQWNYNGEKYEDGTAMPAGGMVLELIIKEKEADPSQPHDFGWARWEFDGDASTTSGSTMAREAYLQTEYGGNPKPVFDGAYRYSDAGVSCSYKLDAAVTLPADNDWSVLWTGRCDENMNDRAGLFASNLEYSGYYIDWVKGKGVEIAFGITDGAAVLLETEETALGMYEMHSWKLEYAASEEKLRLYMDGRELCAENFAPVSDFDIMRMLGEAPVADKCFLGTMEFMEIRISEK